MAQSVSEVTREWHCSRRSAVNEVLHVLGVHGYKAQRTRASTVGFVSVRCCRADVSHVGRIIGVVDPAATPVL